MFVGNAEHFWIRENCVNAGRKKEVEEIARMKQKKEFQKLFKESKNGQLMLAI